MKFVLATHNPNKIREMGAILSQFSVEVVSPRDLGITVDVEETGVTFAENAMLKAKAICELAKLPAIADDSGLCVDALNGAPGVYSARYGGEGLDDQGRYTLLLQNLRGQTTRAAHFTCAIACAFPNGDTITVTKEGIPTVTVSIPLRNMHTPSEVIDLRDVRNTAALLTAYVTGGDIHD